MEEGNKVYLKEEGKRLHIETGGLKTVECFSKRNRLQIERMNLSIQAIIS